MSADGTLLPWVQAKAVPLPVRLLRSEYEDDDEQEEEGDTDLENTYYTAKSLKEDDPDAAIKKFEALLEQEQEKGDWCARDVLSRTSGNLSSQRH